MRVEARAGRLPLPPGWIDEPLLPEPIRFGGRRRARVRIEATFGRRGRRMLPPPALVLRDPLGLAQRTITAGEPDEVLVSRGSPVPPPPAGRTPDAHARALADRGRRDRDRRPAPALRGRPRRASTGRPRAWRRPDGAQAISEADARPLDRARPARAATRRARRGGARRRLARRALRGAQGLRPAATRRTAPARPSTRPAAWPPATPASRSTTSTGAGAARRAEPARPGGVRRCPDHRPLRLAERAARPAVSLLVIPGELPNRRSSR